MRLQKSELLNDKGFSLVGVLMALVLLTFGILAWGGVVGSVMDRNTANERMSVAVALAEEKMEELTTRAKTTVIDDTDDGTQIITASGVAYSVTTDVINGGTGNLTDLTVTITWSDNLPSTYTLNTRVHQS